MSTSHDGVLVLGEAWMGIDSALVAGPLETPGGSGFDVAVSLARLDVQTRLLTALGTDRRGARILDTLRDSGVIAVGDPCRLPQTSTVTTRTPHDSPCSRAVARGIRSSADPGGRASVRR